MRFKGKHAVYGLLAILWCAIGLWQAIEHMRVLRSARESLYRRAADISNTVGVVIRSQRLFVTQKRLETALQQLATSQDMRSVAVLNASGEVVAHGGQVVSEADIPESAEKWGDDTLTVEYPVDFGAEMDSRGEMRLPFVIVTDREPGPPPPPPPDGSPPPFPPPWERDRMLPPGPWVRGATSEIVREASRTLLRGRNDSRRPERMGRFRRFRRPPEMNEQLFKELLQKKGLHGFILVMSISAYRSSVHYDLWLRLVIMAVTTVAAVGLGMAWRNLQRSSHLQMRLIRASEMNEHLREMNIAAAGLAHETRNPLNIVRGLAQMISTRSDASPEVRRQAKDITEEVDRVAARLNEFIEYSRPPVTRPAPRHINAVIRDVERTLESDKEEKSVSVRLTGPELVVEADEPSLRQIFFNLILNAIQAVQEGGQIEVVIEESGSDEAIVEVRDNGPGVPEEARHSIFRPYFTTHEGGTGLGLAVVRQIVLANGWEIEYTPGMNGGAVFRIQGLKIISRNP
jgi:signal transduction histidine kinase